MVKSKITDNWINQEILDLIKKNQRFSQNNDDKKG